MTFPDVAGGGVKIHPERARMSGRHGVQYVAQRVTFDAGCSAVNYQCLVLDVSAVRIDHFVGDVHEAEAATVA